METQIFKNSNFFSTAGTKFFFVKLVKPSSAGNASFYCTILHPTIKITNFFINRRY